MSLAWGGVNIMGEAHNWTPAAGDEITAGGDKFTTRTAAIEAAKKGKIMYDNQALLIDGDVGPRLKRPLDSASKNPNAIKDADMVSTACTTAKHEPTRPFGFRTNMQQLGFIQCQPLSVF